MPPAKAVGKPRAALPWPGGKGFVAGHHAKGLWRALRVSWRWPVYFPCRIHARCLFSLVEDGRAPCSPAHVRPPRPAKQIKACRATALARRWRFRLFLYRAGRRSRAVPESADTSVFATFFAFAWTALLSNPEFYWLRANPLREAVRGSPPVSGSRIYLRIAKSRSSPLIRRAPGTLFALDSGSTPFAASRRTSEMASHLMQNRGARLGGGTMAHVRPFPRPSKSKRPVIGRSRLPRPPAIPNTRWPL
jgi:hypothetical protein